MRKGLNGKEGRKGKQLKEGWEMRDEEVEGSYIFD